MSATHEMPSIEQVLQAAGVPAAAASMFLETLHRMTPDRRRELAAAIAAFGGAT